MYKYISIYSEIFIVFSFAGCGTECQNMCSRQITFNNQSSNDLKVMTFNIRVNTIIDGPNRWAKRSPIAINTIALNNPDIFGLQEAKMTQIQQIQKSLPQYAAYAAGRSNGKTKGESCPIFYHKNRFKMIDSGTFWFSQTPHKAGSKDWGNLFPRICSWIKLNDEQSHKSFYIYNLHLDNLSQNSRRKSIQLLADTVASRKVNDPFVILGDFNMETDNPAMNPLTNNDYRSGTIITHNVMALSSLPFKNLGTRHGFKGKVSGPRIDHIYVSKNFDVRNAKIDRYSEKGRYPSDHFPVVAKVIFQETGNTNYLSQKVAGGGNTRIF